MDTNESSFYGELLRHLTLAVLRLESSVGVAIDAIEQKYPTRTDDLHRLNEYTNVIAEKKKSLIKLADHLDSKDLTSYKVELKRLCALARLIQEDVAEVIVEMKNPNIKLPHPQEN